MAKKLSIIDQLNALCDQVIVDTTKAKETYQMSEDKLIEYVGNFAHTLAKKYCTTLKKYGIISSWDHDGSYHCAEYRRAFKFARMCGINPRGLGASPNVSDN